MIDEDDLRRLLADSAEAVPPPGRAPQALFDAVAEQASVPPPRHVPWTRMAAVAAAIVLAVALGTALVLLVGLMLLGLGRVAWVGVRRRMV